MTTISLVIPCYNEEDAIDGFWRDITRTIAQAKNLSWEFIFIDDGSSDATVARLTAYLNKEKKHRIKIITFSRNFGKEAALLAGLKHAAGDAVIPCDIDLQDPPHIILAMIQKWQRGADTVIGIRSDRASDGWLKRNSANLFYKVMTHIAKVPIHPHAGDFRLLSRKVVDAITALNENTLFMKGIFAWVGFSQAFVHYERVTRTEGASKFNLISLVNKATDGIVAFSSLPLRIWFYVGLIIALVSFAYASFLIIKTLAFGIDAPGYASLMVAVLFFGGLQLLVLGVIGEYLAHTLAESKQRPPYIVDAIHDNQKTHTNAKTKAKTKRAAR